MIPLQDSMESQFSQRKSKWKKRFTLLSAGILPVISDLFHQKIKTISFQLLITIHFSFNDVVSLNACSKVFMQIFRGLSTVIKII